MVIVRHSTPLFVLASMNWTNRQSVDYDVKVDVNKTACSYLKQFDLKDHVILRCVTETAESFWICACPYSVEPKAIEYSPASNRQCE